VFSLYTAKITGDSSAPATNCEYFITATIVIQIEVELIEVKNFAFLSIVGAFI
jgi:hypothetical protein